MRSPVKVGSALIVGVALGGTILASPVAQAAQAILPVQVMNTPANPVPVREQASVATAQFSAGGFGVGSGAAQGCKTPTILASTLVLSAWGNPVRWTIGVTNDGCVPGFDIDEISLEVIVAPNQTMAVALPDMI